eukprot:5753598-Prymnesium_polylepis.2
MLNFNNERLMLAAQSEALARACYEEALEWAARDRTRWPRVGWLLCPGFNPLAARAGCSARDSTRWPRAGWVPLLRAVPCEASIARGRWARQRSTFGKRLIEHQVRAVVGA